MTTKNMGYDHPAYLARQQHSFPSLAAGASGITSKFVAFANLQVYSVTAATVTAGSSTSTYTQWNGTATVTAVSADSFSVIRVANIAAAGTTPVLTTSTYGPFVNAPYNGTLTATQTGLAVVANNIALYGTITNTAGTATNAQVQAGSNAGTGGFTINQGDIVYCTRGTDASAVTALALEFSIVPLANVTN